MQAGQIKASQRGGGGGNLLEDSSTMPSCVGLPLTLLSGSSSRALWYLGQNLPMETPAMISLELGRICGQLGLMACILEF